MPDIDSRPVIFGTAGHIDHGKTTLTQRLTGVNTDRLPEERSRGISIDLGFAHFDLPSGRHAALIDVPGHEKFIRNMVAGVHGMDAVLLVVAADEGVMPQTREHLDILTLLGVKNGLTVITKADFVESEWLPIVDDTVQEALSGSFLAQTPRIFVDSLTGRGIDDLLSTLDELVGQLPSRNARGPVRLPVDRVFSVKGFGTVVTGTLVSGTIRADMSLEVVPGNQTVRVRGLEVHGSKVGQAVAGQRVAVNLSGLDKEMIRRGQVLSEMGSINAHDVLVTELTLLSTSPALPQRTRVHVHLGTAEVTGRIYSYEQDEIDAGSSSFAEIRLEGSLPAERGDRFLIRSYSPVTTIGGGRVIEVGRHHKRKEAGLVNFLHLVAQGVPEDLVRAVLRKTDLPQSIGDIVNESGLVTRDVEKICANRPDIYYGPDRLVLGTQQLLPWSQQLVEFLQEYHQSHPLRHGIERERLRDALWPRWSMPQILFVVAHSPEVRVTGEWMHLAAFSPTTPEPWKSELEALYSAIVDNALRPIGLDQLQDQLPIAADHLFDVVEFLVQQGRIVRLDEGLYIADRVFKEAKQRVIDVLSQKSAQSTSQLREVLGTNRRYAVLFLELLDALHITRRVGDNRTLVG